MNLVPAAALMVVALACAPDAAAQESRYPMDQVVSIHVTSGLGRRPQLLLTDQALIAAVRNEIDSLKALPHRAWMGRDNECVVQVDLVGSLGLHVKLRVYDDRIHYLGRSRRLPYREYMATRAQFPTLYSIADKVGQPRECRR